MIVLKEVVQEIYPVVEKHKSKLESRYAKVEYSYSDQGFFLTCSSRNYNSISLRVIPDYERRSLNLPKTGAEY